MRLYQMQDDFAVGFGLECRTRWEGLFESEIVVNLSVDAEDLLSVLADQGLGTGVCGMKRKKEKKRVIEVSRKAS